MIGTRRPAVLAAALIVAAGAFDSPSLFVPGIALGLLDGGLWVWVRLAARRTRASIAPMARSVEEGSGLPVSVELSARPRGVGLSVEHPLLAGGESRPVFASRRATASIVFEGPGRKVVDPVRLVINDPLGLHRGVVATSARAEVLVLPRIEPVQSIDGSGALTGRGAAGAAGRGEAGSGAATQSIDFELDGLRPYQEGGSASRIHWPSVARRGELVEHRLLSGAAEVPVVVLDLSGSPKRDAVEGCLRAAASIVHELSQNGACLLVSPGREKPVRVESGWRSWPAAHARIACVRAGAAAEAPRGLRASRGLIVITPGDSLPVSLRSLGSAGGLLVTPAFATSPLASFTVAGCGATALSSVRPARRPVPVESGAA